MSGGGPRPCNPMQYEPQAAFRRRMRSRLPRWRPVRGRARGADRFRRRRACRQARGVDADRLASGADRDVESLDVERVDPADDTGMGEARPPPPCCGASCRRTSLASTRLRCTLDCRRSLGAHSIRACPISTTLPAISTRTFEISMGPSRYPRIPSRRLPSGSRAATRAASQRRPGSVPARVYSSAPSTTSTSAAMKSQRFTARDQRRNGCASCRRHR